MKRFTLFVAMVVAVVGTAQAQNFTNTGSGVNVIDSRDGEEEAGPARSEPAPKVVYASPYSMELVTMEASGEKIAFSNLPDISMTMHVTDGSGNEIMSRRISRENSTASIKSLKKGIHFITLVSDNTGARKAFTLNRN